MGLWFHKSINGSIFLEYSSEVYLLKHSVRLNNDKALSFDHSVNLEILPTDFQLQVYMFNLPHLPPSDPVTLFACPLSLSSVFAAPPLHTSKLPQPCLSLTLSAQPHFESCPSSSLMNKIWAPPALPAVFLSVTSQPCSEPSLSFSRSPRPCLHA